MNTGTTIDRVHQPPGSDQETNRVADHSASSAATPTTADLVHATRQQVQQITQEIAELAQQDLSRESFFTQFLQHVTGALASFAGGVWSVDSQGKLRSIAQINGPSAEEGGEEIASDEHLAVLARAAAIERPIALGPQSSSQELGATNPTDHLLLVAPLRLEGRVVAVAEVYQRPHRGPATERGYMAYLLQVSELAEQFLQHHELRSLRAHHDWSQQLEQFLAQIHNHLGVDETAFNVVNEARRLANVDRVSLALGTGRRCRLKAVSGLDSVDRRAEQIRKLGRLATRINQGREPIWLDSQNSDLPPQIERDWNQYVDISHVRRCIVVPLMPPARDASQRAADRRVPYGTLIFEQLRDDVPDTHRHARNIEQVCRHSSSALHNALQHENLFLMPLWRTLGNVLEALGGRHFWKTLLVTILCVSAVVALTTTKTEFTVPVRGKLQPELRRTVFAREDGVVTQVHVEHGQIVQAGQVLVELRNTDLGVEITTLVGKQTATREQILSLQRALLDDPHLDTAQQNRLNGELLQLQQTAQSIERQLQLVRQKEQHLIVRAERAGQVVTWHVADLLRHRPVQKGEALMAIVDPTGQWELELLVPVRHCGHVLDAAERDKQPLSVTFVLSSHPQQQFTGTLQAVDHVAVQNEELGNVVRIRVAIDAQQLPELKTDATVIAKVHCGQRSLGYAWFHDLIDTVQSRVLFWL